MIVEHPLESGAKADKASAPPRAVRGHVVDVRIDERVPAIHSVLRPRAEKEIIIEVFSQWAQGDAR